MQLKKTAIDLIELFFIAAIMFRGGCNQLGYAYIVGEHPECKTTRELTTDVPVVLTNIKPWAVYVVHLFSPLVGIALIIYFVIIFHWSASPSASSMYVVESAPLLGQLRPSSPLESIALLVVAANVLFVLLWDPLVLLARGPADRIEPAEDRSEPTERAAA